MCHRMLPSNCKKICGQLHDTRYDVMHCLLVVCC